MEDLIKGWISEIVPPPTEKTQGKANIEVSSDADCDILKTGEVIATIAKGGYNILKLPHGEHRLVCRSNEFSDIEQEVKLEIAKDLPDAFFDIKLEKRIQSRRKKRERNRYWEETLRPLLKKIGKGLAIALAAVAIVWALVQAFRSCEGTTETATVTDTEPIVNVNDTTELLAVVPTNSEMLDSKPANESVASEAEVQRQAELEKQKAQQEKKRQAEEKKNRDEKKFNEYKAKGDEYYLLLVGNPDNKNYKDQAKYYYGLALQYKEDAKVRNRFETLKK